MCGQRRGSHLGPRGRKDANELTGFWGFFIERVDRYIVDQ